MTGTCRLRRKAMGSPTIGSCRPLRKAMGSPTIASCRLPARRAYPKARQSRSPALLLPYAATGPCHLTRSRPSFLQCRVAAPAWTRGVDRSPAVSSGNFRCSKPGHPRFHPCRPSAAPSDRSRAHNQQRTCLRSRPAACSVALRHPRPRTTMHPRTASSSEGCFRQNLMRATRLRQRQHPTARTAQRFSPRWITSINHRSARDASWLAAKEANAKTTKGGNLRPPR